MNQSSKWGSTTAKVLELLADFGPMTRAEICKHLGRDKNDIASVVSRLNKASKTYPKRVYIQKYVATSTGERKYPRAVFALGDKRDKAKPVSNAKQIKDRYLKRLRAKTMKTILFLLRTQKPMTLPELLEELSLEIKLSEWFVSSCLSELRQKRSNGKAKVYIAEYRKDPARWFLAPVYANGSKEDVAKPRSTGLKRKASPNSVFQLGDMIAARSRKKTCTTSSESTAA